MSFSGAVGQKNFKPNPPQRGSFPLDHYAECKAIMATYLQCLKAAKGMNDKCRDQAKGYLACRMERNLMARDEMRNLGFPEEERAAEGQAKGNT